MQVQESLHSRAWRDADARSPSLFSRRFHTVAGIAAVAALAASVGIHAVNDPRPLDEQLTAAMQKAGEGLQAWQGELSRGLQVSLRAVADGSESPAAPQAVALGDEAALQPAATPAEAEPAR